MNKKILYFSVYRTIATLLSLAFVLQLAVFMPVMLSAEEVFPEESSEYSVFNAEPEPEIVYEDVALREENVKHFLLSNGAYIAAVYDSPVHYSAEGEWKDIDNTLTLQNALDNEDISGFVNTSSELRFKFANKSSSSKLFRIKYKSYEISWGIAEKSVNSSFAAVTPGNDGDLTGNEAETAIEKLYSSVTYANALPDTDIRYDVMGNDVKENIILKSTDASNSISFDLTLKNLTPVLLNDGGISLTDNNTSEEVFVIPAPFMTDAENKYSEDVAYTLTQGNGNGKYILTVTADNTWLSTATYPVTVDPVITYGYDGSQSSHYSQSSPSTSTSSPSVMNVGKYNGSIYRSWYKPKLPELCPNDAVYSAVIAFYQYANYYNNYQTDTKRIYAYMSEADSPTWNTQSYSSEVLDFNVRDTTNDTVIEYDITKAVKEWYKGTVDTNGFHDTNHGIIFIGGDEASTGTNAYVRYRTQASSVTAKRPLLYITYVNTKGIEDFQSYHSISADGAGTGYVNDYSGNLVFAFTDRADAGTRMPVTVSHVYNSASVNDTRFYTRFFNTEMKVGNGWKLNVQEKIRNVQNIDDPTLSFSDSTYIYVDEDGTEHFFSLTSINGSIRSFSSVTMEDHELVRDATSSPVIFTLTNDKTHTVKTFDADGYITSYADKNGNVLTYTYEAVTVNGAEGKKITKLTDGSGRETAITYGNTSDPNLVTRITFSDGQFKEYTYTNGSLTGVTHYYSSSTSAANDSYTYTYNGQGQLITAKDEQTGRETAFTYTGGRVTGISEYADNGTEESLQGRTVSITYNNDATTEYRIEGESIISHIGFDRMGRPITAYVTNADKTVLYGQSSAEYMPYETSVSNILTTTATGRQEGNYVLSQASFEQTTLSGWSVSTSSTGTGSAILSTDQAFIGDKALKLSVTNAGTVRARCTSYVRQAPWTLSVYVKATEAYTGELTLGFFKTEDIYEEHEGITYQELLTYPEENGWRRISFTTENTALQGLTDIYVGLNDGTGTVYIDAVQAEASTVPTYFNFVNSGGFDFGTGSWNVTGNTAEENTVDGQRQGGGDVLCLAGDPGGEVKATQNIPVGDSSGYTYILSGWGKADSAVIYDSITESTYSSDRNVAAKTGRRFMLAAELTYTRINNDTQQESTATETYEIPFNYSYSGWQYVTKPLVIHVQEGYTVKETVKIRISCVYSNNVNTAYFDDIALVRDLAYTYTYDENGNVLSTQSLKEIKTGMEYSSENELLQQQNATGGSYTYTYNDDHDLLTATSERGVTTSLTYNAYGSATSATVSGTGVNNGKLYSEATYTADGNYTQTLTDSRGLTTVYNTRPNGMLIDTTSPDGTKTAYTYNTKKNVSKLTHKGSDNAVLDTVQYTYTEQGYLNTVVHNGTTYTFIYDVFGNSTGINVGTRALAEYTYESNNGNLTRSDYGNGAYVEYTYDELDRISEVTYNGNEEAAVEYYYDHTGNAGRITDGLSGEETEYFYDSISRPISSRKVRNTDTQTAAYTYDELSRISGITYKLNNANVLEYGYTYGQDHLVTETELPGGYVIQNTYDHLNRPYVIQTKTPQNAAVITEEYEYLDGDVTKQNATTVLTEYHTQAFGGEEYETWYAYEDDTSRLTDIYGPFENKYFEYNENGYLTYCLDSDSETEYIYTYTGTNISGYTVRDFNENVLYSATFGYTDATWKDLLTGYNGQSITYDGIGNPLSYRDGITFTWQNGRQLSGYTKGTDNISFTYNGDGIRTSKTVNGIKTEYFLNGSDVIYMRTGNTVTSFIYDENGEVTGLIHNGATYFYVKNILGDVAAIIDTSGTTVAEYKYDPWGRVLAVTDADGNSLLNASTHIANINPFRYRSYFYDTETELYYCNSRYYDPKICRWINADRQMSGINGDISGYNLFAYCFNDPVNLSDEDGDWPQWVKDTVKSVATVVKSVVDAIKEGTNDSKTAITIKQNFNLAFSNFSFSFSINLTAHSKGTILCSNTTSINASTSSSSGSVSSQTCIGLDFIENANDVLNAGRHYSVSATAPIPYTPISGDGAFTLNEYIDTKNKTSQYGVSCDVGAAFPQTSGAEFAVGAGLDQTNKVYSFNVYDMFYTIYDDIMVW